MLASRSLCLLLSASLILGLGLLGCSSDDDSSDKGNAGGANSGGGGTAGTGGSETICYSVETNETNDGTCACGGTVCPAGEYCSDNMFCYPGCLDELDCAPHQTCDLSNAQGVPAVGLCRAPNASETVACATGGSGGGGSTDCLSACSTKAIACQAPSGTADTYCAGFCASASADQVQCAVDSSCEDLYDAFMNGEGICGVGG